MPLRYGNVVTPVYVESSQGVIRNVGSGTLVRSDEGFWLFSAAHVLAEHENGMLLLPGRPDFFTPSGVVFSTCELALATSHKDRLDMAYLELTSEEADKLEAVGASFLDASRNTVEPSGRTPISSKGTLVGFPVGSVWIQGRQANVHPTTLGPFAFAADERLSRAGFNPEISLGLVLPRKLAKEGERMFSFDPRGMSGGAVWLHGDNGPKLIGLATEFHPHRSLLIGTRISVLLRGLVAHLRTDDFKTSRKSR